MDNYLEENNFGWMEKFKTSKWNKWKKSDMKDGGTHTKNNESRTEFVDDFRIVTIYPFFFDGLFW